MQYRRKHDRIQPRGWFSLFIRLGGWAALILGGLVVVLTLISASQLWIADRLDVDGRITGAVVADKRVKLSTDSDGDTTREHFVTLKFKTADGGRSEEVEVSRKYYASVSEGDEVVIRYLRSDPSLIETEIGAYRRGGIILRWIGLFVGLAGLWALWRFGSAANRALLARRYGEKRLAEVTGIRELNVRVNKRPQGRLMWREPDGQVGESLMRDMAELSRLYKAGDSIVVFRRGGDAFWEGDVGPPQREVES